MSNLSNEKKRKYRTKIKRRRIVTLCSLVLIIVVLGVVIFKVFFNNKDNKLSSKGPNETSTTTTSNDTSTASETSSPSQSNNKNGYLCLEEDPNAEDALEVFANKNTSVKKKANSFLYFERDIFVFSLNKYFVQRRQTS